MPDKWRQPTGSTPSSRREGSAPGDRASPTGVSVEKLIRLARDGGDEALGLLLDMYRNYLKVMARVEMGSFLRLRLESSDVVQGTLLEAYRDYDRFAGTTEGELRTWLRRILVHNVVDEARRQHAELRDGRRERSLQRLAEQVGFASGDVVAARTATPSGEMTGREDAALLADALTRLPADQSEVLVLRHVERLSFDDVARRMRRSPGAARMLWLRAVQGLRAELRRAP